MISGKTTVVAAKDQVSCDLAGEAAILNLKTGIYYGLNVVGARIWDLIQSPKTVTGVRDALLEEFEVDAELCQNDLITLLEELKEQELIEICDDAAH